MNEDNHHVNSQIAERYGPYARQVTNESVALSFDADGCAPQTAVLTASLAEQLYPAEQLAEITAGAVEAALGCGNPLAIASLRPGERVLDLGSGGGIDCFLAAKAVGPGGYVIGVDATPDMIALAKRNKEKMGLNNVEFRLGQIEALPVSSGSIDLIISNCVIDISPDKTAVFAEAYRVLKVDGQMAISDTVLLGDIPPQLKRNIDVWAGAVITPLIALDEYLDSIAGAGFVDIRVESLTSYGLEQFEQLDEASRSTLTNGGVSWTPLPPMTGLYSARIAARKLV